jgi:uncharacterized protein GlcG (DUF336 family)
MSRARRPFTVLAAIASLVLSACGGGGGGGGSATPSAPSTPSSVYLAPGAQSLSVSDVQQIIAQAVAEAKARGTPAMISVTDRVGNVLAVYQMVGAPSTLVIRNGPGANIDLQGKSPPTAPPMLGPPAALAAIAKAITGAYLSSGGNAFSTRTASEIVQNTFPPSPATVGLGSGPLFGVQFSSLPCSDLEFPTLGHTIGPKPSPLGLAGDPGGFPLYKNGVLVGGVGVKSNTDYGFDPDVTAANAQQLGEEAVALAGTVGFDAPAAIRADQITVGGNSLIYSNATLANLISTPASAPSFASLGAGSGALVAVTGFYAGAAVIAGQVYGTEASGVRPATPAEFNNPDAFVLTDGAGNPRFAPTGGSDAAEVTNPLTSAEVTSLLQNAFNIMSNTRAQIRSPLDSRAQVTISVVDTRGKVLGIVRSPDAPMFGVDVSLQKARTASFFSSASAAGDLAGDGVADSHKADVQSFLPATRAFLADASALTGRTAFSVRSVAGLARPQFPNGQVGGPTGPLSRPISQWSIFATGLQTALVDANLLNALGANTGDPLNGTLASRCTFLPDASPGLNRLQNGIQIFAGGEPIYRGGVLVGAIGISGDGTSQDDMIGFLGLDAAHSALGSIQNAPVAIRADQLVINQGGGANHVLYVQCPVAPFLNSTVQDACTGK